MTSNIDPSKPVGPIAYTSDVRANLAAAKGEIEELQDYTASLVQGGIGGIIDARDYIAADGVTDDTDNFAAAIAAAQATVPGGQCARLTLPKGRILTGPQTITNQILIQGAHDNSTVLVLKTGSTAACLTINPSGAAFPGGSPRGRVILQDLRIECQSGKVGNANAHGISLVQNSAWTCHVTLQRVTIYGMPANGINSLLFNGWVDAYDCSIFNNNVYGVSCNSCNDWHWYGGDIAVNGTDGVLLSGCSQFVYIGTNIYSNGQHNLFLYSGAGIVSGNHMFTDCMFDRGNQIGVLYGMAGASGAIFKGCTFGLASQVTPGTYSDVVISSGANELAMFSGCWWGNNHPTDSAFTEKLALEFQGASQTVVVDPTNVFAGGTLRTNAITQVYLTNKGTREAFRGPTGVFATQQFTGLQVNNEINPVINMVGFTPTNDSGVITLLNNGVAGAQLSAATAWAANFINGDLHIGLPTSATPVTWALRGTDAAGTDIAGSTLIIAPGRGTGAAQPGAVSFRFAPAGASGSALNPEVERFVVGGSNGAVITATQEFTGLGLSNSANLFAKIIGFLPSNDAGVFNLFNAGNTLVQLSAAAGAGAPNYINAVLYLGNADTNATPVGQALRATGGLGTDVAGASLYLDGGIGTGAGVGGGVHVRSTRAGTSGAAQNTLVDSLIVDGPGNVVAGSGALATTATSGFLYIPTCAGTPTGVPTGVYTGRVPLTFDTVANKLWLYAGGWKGMVAA